MFSSDCGRNQKAKKKRFIFTTDNRMFEIRYDLMKSFYKRNRREKPREAGSLRHLVRVDYGSSRSLSSLLSNYARPAIALGFARLPRLFSFTS